MSWYEEIERTRPIVDMMVPVRKLLPMFEGRDFKHEKPFGFAKRGVKHVLLNLDTDRDRLVAKLRLLLGCTFNEMMAAYYVHKDEAGMEYLYKIGSKKQGNVTWSMREKMHEYLKGVVIDIADHDAVEKIKKDMLLTLGSQVIAERVTGTRVMSRKDILHDFTRLGENEWIDIRDKGLEQNHAPRPTSRGVGGGYPSPNGMLLSNMEEVLYWNRLKKREPIPQKVWKLLESVHSGKLDENVTVRVYEVKLVVVIKIAQLLTPHWKHI